MNAIFYNDWMKAFVPHQLVEIWIEGLYNAYYKGGVVLDLGANIGMFSMYAHLKGAERIIAVEPSKMHCEAMREMIKYNKYNNIEVIQAAVSNRSGTDKLQHPTNLTAFTLSLGVSDKPDENEDVKLMRLGEILEETKLTKVDFMKLDIEGEESQVITDPDFKKLSQNIKTIMYEHHAWSQMNPRLFATALRDMGYEVGKMVTKADVFIAERK